MQHLPLPSTEAEDDAVVRALCRKAPWLPHEAEWLAAYLAYRHAQSDPWIVAPKAFDPDIAGDQYRLYDSRRSGGPIRRIRDTPGLLSCPLCGSPTTGSVDHLLPREAYPEFSIMRANLVPACFHCNSASKGNKHRGAAQSERFIHPYFDVFAAQPLWLARTNPPFEAVTFDAVPLPTLPGPVATIVNYHLSHVLGDEFKKKMASTWSTLPGSLRAALGSTPIDVPSINSQVLTDLTRVITTDGENSWGAAFLRGLTTNPQAISFVANKAATYPD